MAVPFQDGTSLLSYTDDLAIISQRTVSPEPKKPLTSSVRSARNWTSRSWQQVPGNGHQGHYKCLPAKCPGSWTSLDMTWLSAGTISILDLYYMQGVHSLMDYSAPVLIALSHPQQECLEVVQNSTMRTMLRVLRWSSPCIMQ